MSQANLDINVNAQVNGTNQVSDLKSQFDGLKASAEQASSGGEKASTSFSRFKNVAKSISNETKAVGKGIGRNLVNSIKSIDMPFKNLFKSLTRIAKLRLLRGIIRSITGAFKEGLGNIYQYSAALNNTDASHMKSTMDALASSLLYAKNAVGAAVAPLIASLIPTIQQVVQWFVNAASAVAQFFAALGGQTTYTKAKETATQWGAIESGASGAAAAAQEYKNTILGFDEIHALNDVPEDGGGGGGGGAATPDYSNMFEEAEISQKIKDLVKWLKDNWDDILDIVKAIGAALLTWKIANGIADFFKTLEAQKLAGAVEVLAGLVITVIGATLAFKAGYEIGVGEGVDLMDIVKAAIGVGLSGVGGALVAKGLTNMGVAEVGGSTGLLFGLAVGLVATAAGITLGVSDSIRSNGGEIGLADYVKSAVAVALTGGAGALTGIGLATLGIGTIGAGAGVGLLFGLSIGLIGTVIGIQIGQTEGMLDDTYRLTSGYQDYVDTMNTLQEVLSHTNTVVEVAASAWSDYSDKISKVKMAENLIPQIEDLTSKTNRSTLENEKLKSLVEQLNDLGLEGVTAEYDELTGTVSWNTEEIYKNLEAIKANARAEAYLEILKAAWKDQAQAILDNQIAIDAQADADQHLAEAQQALLDYEKEYNGTLEYSEEKHRQLEQAVWDWQEAQSTAYDAVDQTKERMDEANGYVDQAERAYKNLSDELTGSTIVAMDDYTQSAQEAKKETQNYTSAVEDANNQKPTFDGTKSGYGGVRNAAREAKEANDDTKKAVTNFDKDNPAFRGTVKGFDGLRTAAMEADDQVKGGKENLNKLNNYAPTFGRINSAFGNVKTYANGSSGAIKNVRDEATKTGNFNPSTDIIRTALGTIGNKANDMTTDVEAIKLMAEDVGRAKPPTTSLTESLEKIGSKSTTVKNKVSTIKSTAETVGKSSPSMKNLQDALWTAWYAADDDIKKIGGIKTATSDTGKYNPNMSPLQKALWTAWYAADDSIGRINDIYGAVNNLNGLSATISIGVDTVANGAKVALSSVVQDLNKIRGYKYGGFIPGFANGGYVPSFAGGGSLNSASLFIARENQAPEMVGMIGSRTAVANNPQIVEAIEGGVFRAMSQVMSNNQGTTEVNVTIDGQKVARAVDRANKVQNRRFNVQA